MAKKKKGKPEPLSLYNRDEKGNIKSKHEPEANPKEIPAEKPGGIETLSWRSIRLKRKQGA